MAKKGAKRDGSKSVAISDFMAANPGATANEIRAGLAAQGVAVSLGLVNKVKYTKGATGKSTGRAKAKKSAAPKKKATRGRPRAAGGNMSQTIRDYIDANPNQTRPEIFRGLNAQGVKVSQGLVNAVYVKYCADTGKKVTRATRGGGRRAAVSAPAVAALRGKGGRKPRAASVPAAAAGSLSAVELLNAKNMIDQLGGIAKVREALSVLEQLQ